MLMNANSGTRLLGIVLFMFYRLGGYIGLLGLPY